MPHYFLPEACYFITFRLANSLPVNKYQILKDEYDQIKQNIKSLLVSNTEQEQKIRNEWKKYFDKIDTLLHRFAESPKYLQNNKIAEIIDRALKFYDTSDYELICHSIMPNHVHCVLKLNEKSKSLDKIMQSIKRYSARESNKLLNRRGQFWQHENYDHLVYDENELERIVEYILNNPVKAGLVKDRVNWKWNYCRTSF